MSRLGQHHRNHSFPPSLRYVQKPAKTLNQPLPDIDDEPFLHFLANTEEDDGHADYLHFDAGILVESESYKRKINKFRPASHTKRDRTIQHHHGLVATRISDHGFVHNQAAEYSQADLHHPFAMSQPIITRQPRNRNHRHLPGHRHSWQEPSLDLFTVTEEVPQIVISDYDELTTLEPESTVGGSEQLQESESAVEEDKECSIVASGPNWVSDSPRLGACSPAEKPDTQLNQMWFGERARL